MSRSVVIVVLFSLLVASCAKTVQDSSSRSVAAPSSRDTRRLSKAQKRSIQAQAAVDPKYGTKETMQRQVRNAVDAGDGDVRIRGLRQRLASNPDDLEARFALAKYYRELGFADVAIEHLRLAEE